MRTYPINSPQAAARIVALAMLADGQMSRAEIDILQRLRIHEQLGLRPDELHSVVDALCKDMLSTAKLTGATACEIDPRTLAKLMGEIDDPDLHSKVLALCVAVIEADGHVVTAEAIVLTAAVEQWGLQRGVPQPERSKLPNRPNRPNGPNQPNHPTRSVQHA